MYDVRANGNDYNYYMDIKVETYIFIKDVHILHCHFNLAYLR